MNRPLPQARTEKYREKYDKIFRKTEDGTEPVCSFCGKPECVALKWCKALMPEGESDSD